MSLTSMNSSHLIDTIAELEKQAEEKKQDYRKNRTSSIFSAQSMISGKSYLLLEYNNNLKYVQ